MSSRSRSNYFISYVFDRDGLRVLQFPERIEPGDVHKRRGHWVTLPNPVYNRLMGPFRICTVQLGYNSTTPTRK